MEHRGLAVFLANIFPAKLFYFADPKTGVTHQREGCFFLTFRCHDQAFDLIGRKARLWLRLGLRQRDRRQPVIAQDSLPPTPLEDLFGENQDRLDGIGRVLLLDQPLPESVEIVRREAPRQRNARTRAVLLELVEVRLVFPFRLWGDILRPYRIKISIGQLLNRDRRFRDSFPARIQALLNLDRQPTGLRPVRRPQSFRHLFAVGVPVFGSVAAADFRRSSRVDHPLPDRHLRSVDSFSFDKFHRMNSCINRSRQKRSGLPRLIADPYRPSLACLYSVDTLMRKRPAASSGVKIGGSQVSTAWMISLVVSFRFNVSYGQARAMDMYDAYLEQRQLAERFRGMREK